MNRGKELLKPFEPVFAFDTDQRVFVMLSSVMPSLGNYRRALANILLLDQLKTRVGDQLFVYSGRHEQK